MHNFADFLSIVVSFCLILCLSGSLFVNYSAPMDSSSLFLINGTENIITLRKLLFISNKGDSNVWLGRLNKIKKKGPKKC